MPSILWRVEVLRPRHSCVEESTAAEVEGRPGQFWLENAIDKTLPSWSSLLFTFLAGTLSAHKGGQFNRSKCGVDPVNQADILVNKQVFVKKIADGWKGSFSYVSYILIRSAIPDGVVGLSDSVLCSLHKALFQTKSAIQVHVQYEHSSFDQNSSVHDERVRVSIATRFLDFLRNAQMSQQTG